jgi:uncharacterized protein YkwD
MLRSLRFAVPLVTAAVLAAGAVQPAAAARTSNAADARLASQVLVSLNAVRAQHGLVAVVPSASLAAAAQQHSLEMATAGYFAHASHDGTAFWKRIQRYYPSTHSSYWSAGENLLWSSPDVDANQALQLWLASPEHRANILTARWRQIGISVVHADSSASTFGGGPVTFITTDFGVRR